MAMFKSLQAPVVGGLIRSGMGSRIMQVVEVVPHPKHGWLCGVLPVGAFSNGRWVQPGHTQQSSYGYRALKWFHVTASARQGWHPVELGGTFPQAVWFDILWSSPLVRATKPATLPGGRWGAEAVHNLRQNIANSSN